MTSVNLIIDFDSTFVSVEALDELARMVLAEAPDRAERVAEIAQITADGMEGRIGFDVSLARRVEALRPTSEQLAVLAARLRERVTPSVAAKREWIRDNASHVYIVSGGFREFIVPVAREFGMAADHVLANTFVWDGGGRATGVEPASPLAHDGGKALVIAALQMDGPVVMVGDALSDLAAREAGAADAFVAFVENVQRPGVAECADASARDFGQVIHFCEKLVSSGHLADLTKI